MRDEKWVGRRHVDPYVTAAWLVICACAVVLLGTIGFVCVMLAGIVS